MYSAFGTLLTTSKTLVTALERSDTLDRILIGASILLFCLVAAYIVKKRVIDKGLWLAFWWVKYLPAQRPAPPAPPAPPAAVPDPAIVNPPIAPVLDGIPVPAPPVDPAAHIEL